MERYYTPKGCPVHGTAYMNNNDVEVPKLGFDQERYNTIAKGIKKDTVIQPDFYNYTHRKLTAGIDKVFGDVRYDSPDFGRAFQLKQNASRFAGFKSAWQTKHARDAEDDADLSKLNRDYNTNYMRTEYVHGVRSSRSAKKWQKYEQDKDLYPYLEYMPSSSAEPRQSHQRLYGVTKPVDDPFWDTWMPPSDWGCKCGVEQRRRNDRGRDVPEGLPQPPQQFRNNPGKTGRLFTDDHPMIAGPPEGERKAIEKTYKTLQRRLQRIQVRKLAESKFTGKSFKTPDGKNIMVNHSGIKKAVNQPHDNYLIKNELVKHLDEVIHDAAYVKKMKPRAKRLSTLSNTYIYKVKVKRDNYYLVVWEYRNGTYTLHSITDKIKEQ